MKVKLAAMFALVLLLAPAAFAAEVELSEIQRPVDMTESVLFYQAQSAETPSEEEAAEVIRHEG
ncbi:MAG: hypothetical protein ACRDFA_10585 [bacterium]